MKKFLKILAFVVALLVLAAGILWYVYFRPAPPAISDADRARLEIMPLPAKLKLKDGAFVIPQTWSIQYTAIRTARIEGAADRFFIRLTRQTKMNFSSKTGPQLIIDCSRESPRYPNLQEDESYTLMVSTSQIVLKAADEYGILRGLNTLAQMVQRQGDNWVIPAVELEDQPRYTWRGLMIDVCRHWIPKEVILRNLDAMAAVKLNVLHLHLSDYQGFRVESRRYPRLQEQGSEGNYYTQDDIREMVNYAAERGIRIIPEFDLPGHSTSWLVGYPELGSAPGPYTIDGLAGVLNPVLDPTREEVYRFLDGIIGEMAGLFPDSVLHIGGDEVNPHDWNENPSIQQFIQDHQLTDNHGLQAYFNQRLFAILTAHGKRMMGWDEILHPDLPPSGIIIQPWRDPKALWAAARQGYDGVLSNGYYLDYKQPAGKHYQVDPEIIPGAVTIEIDSSNWQSWKTTITFQDNVMDGELYLFGQDGDLRGIIQSMGNTASFTDPVWENNLLTFSNESSFGRIKYELTAHGDSLSGTMRIALFSLDIKGVKNGGSDRPDGDPLPLFEKIEPLTGEETRHILGGEACMWTEMVSAQTLEGRVWPRMAAIAEKWWSPQSLTSDVKDMYRRLWITEEGLVRQGLQSHSNQYDLLTGITGKWSPALQDFADVLQEDLFFNRMTIYPQPYNVKMPLDRMVDAAMPESKVAYRFNQLAQEYVSSPRDSLRAQIISWLDRWIESAAYVESMRSEHPELDEVAPHADHLSRLSRLVIAKLNQEQATEAESEIQELLQDAGKPFGGTLLVVNEGLSILLQ
ncbi:MAG: family 20 glycosylhydrolase [Saprospiraceae bacterium]|nr:family 20 glycosylhydrolase [Saprospiraceae bacterium]MCB9320125.1 family 20 glycosylhydrolase [Lewinellaceae bacterium]